MGYPGVSANILDGNLQREITVLDGVPALICTAKTVGLIGVVKQVYGVSDAISKGFTLAAEPFAHGLISAHYTELGGSQLLYVLGTAETETMQDVLDSTSDDFVKKVMRESKGAVNLFAIARDPGVGYSAGAAFLDADVALSVTASKTLGQGLQAANTPVRFFIEGRVANKDMANSYSPNTATNPYASVVLGGLSANGSAAVTVALARAVKYAAHVKLGSGRNGVLSISQVYIGADKIEERADMETLHDAGFLTFHSRPGSTGYYFGKDNMCDVGDYRILARGRVIDKAQRVSVAAAMPYVEDYIVFESDGTLDPLDAGDMENVVKTALNNSLKGQVSGLDVYVPLDQDIISTDNFTMQVKVLPLGYMTWITISIGLTATLETGE